MSKMKLLLSAFIFCLMLAFLPFVPVQQASAKKVTKEYSKGTLFIYDKKSRTVNLKDVKPKKKLVWRSTNRKVARVVKTTGKYKQKAVIKPGKSGSCSIYTTVNGKRYSYDIVVYKWHYKNGKSKMVINRNNFDKANNKFELGYRLCNGYKKTVMEYGESFRIEKKKNGKWVEVPMKEDFCFNDIAHILYPKQAKTETIKMENYYDLSLFTDGKYRLVKPFGAKLKNSYAEFAIGIPEDSKTNNQYIFHIN